MSGEIKSKMESVKNIIMFLPDPPRVKYRLELHNIEMKLALSINCLFPIDSQTKVEYIRKIMTGGQLSRLDNLLARCEAYMTTKIMKQKYKECLEILSRPINIEIAQKVNTDVCKLCGWAVIVDCFKSELHCANSDCMAIFELNGTVFDESQLYCQDGQKSRSGTFNPNRHFQQWWDHILAREPEEEIGDKTDPDNTMGEKLIENCRRIIARDRLVLRMINVDCVRRMLQELKLTKYNRNVPLIMKKLTGIGPPQLSDELSIRVENLFTKAIEIEEMIRPINRTNRNYYSYYIYKILDHLIPESDRENRRVLYYIYMQSKDTVETDDIEWAKICAELKEIQYKPTDRTMAQKYKPI